MDTTTKPKVISDFVNAKLLIVAPDGAKREINLQELLLVLDNQANWSAPYYTPMDMGMSGTFNMENMKMNIQTLFNQMNQPAMRMQTFCREFKNVLEGRGRFESA